MYPQTIWFCPTVRVEQMLWRFPEMLIQVQKMYQIPGIKPSCTHMFSRISGSWTSNASLHQDSLIKLFENNRIYFFVSLQHFICRSLLFKQKNAFPSFSFFSLTNSMPKTPQHCMKLWDKQGKKPVDITAAHNCAFIYTGQRPFLWLSASVVQNGRSGREDKWA